MRWLAAELSTVLPVSMLPHLRTTLCDRATRMATMILAGLVAGNSCCAGPSSEIDALYSAGRDTCFGG
jgi:hypothetical protein